MRSFSQPYSLSLLSLIFHFLISHFSFLIPHLSSLISHLSSLISHLHSPFSLSQHNPRIPRVALRIEDAQRDGIFTGSRQRDIDRIALVWAVGDAVIRVDC